MHKILKMTNKYYALLIAFTKVHTPNTPIDLGTPLNFISEGIDINTKEVVVFEDTLPFVGTYYYKKK